MPGMVFNGYFSRQSVRSTRFRRISFLSRKVTLSGQKNPAKRYRPPELCKKMGWEFLFQHLDRIGKSANLFSTNAIICEIAVFMTSFLKNKCS